MDQDEHTPVAENVAYPRIRPLSVREQIQQHRQARWLRRMSEEWEEEHDPITEEMMERVWRVWPADAR